MKGGRRILAAPTRGMDHSREAMMLTRDTVQIMAADQTGADHRTTAALTRETMAHRDTITRDTTPAIMKATREITDRREADHKATAAVREATGHKTMAAAATP